MADAKENVGFLGSMMGAVGDVFKYTGVMGGIRYTFDTVGSAAGFQSVFSDFNESGKVDTSDAGLEKMFYSVDTDKSGKISDVEMKGAIKKLYGVNLDEKLVDDMMKAADTNNDKEISLEEFKVIMRAKPEKKPAFTSKWTSFSQH